MAQLLQEKLCLWTEHTVIALLDLYGKDPNQKAMSLASKIPLFFFSLYKQNGEMMLMTG